MNTFSIWLHLNEQIGTDRLPYYEAAAQLYRSQLQRIESTRLRYGETSPRLAFAKLRADMILKELQAHALCS